VTETVRIAWFATLGLGREDRDVPAVAINGPLAVTEIANGRYTVTHLKSGYAVCGGGFGSAASRKVGTDALAELMALPVDWNQSRTALTKFVRRDSVLLATIRSIQSRFQ
jgi:hypothetical protein